MAKSIYCLLPRLQSPAWIGIESNSFVWSIFTFYFWLGSRVQFPSVFKMKCIKTFSLVGRLGQRIQIIWVSRLSRQIQTSEYLNRKSHYNGLLVLAKVGRRTILTHTVDSWCVGASFQQFSAQCLFPAEGSKAVPQALWFYVWPQSWQCFPPSLFANATYTYKRFVMCTIYPIHTSALTSSDIIQSAF